MAATGLMAALETPGFSPVSGQSLPARPVRRAISRYIAVERTKIRATGKVRGEIQIASIKYAKSRHLLYPAFRGNSLRQKSFVTMLRIVRSRLGRPAQTTANRHKRRYLSHKMAQARARSLTRRMS